MLFPDPVVFRQLTVIRKIIADETWLESERRGCRVSEHDPVVVENVCRIVLQIGAQLRERLSVDLEAGPAKLPPPARVDPLHSCENRAA